MESREIFTQGTFKWILVDKNFSLKLIGRCRLFLKMFFFSTHCCCAVATKSNDLRLLLSRFLLHRDYATSSHKHKQLISQKSLKMHKVYKYRLPFIYHGFWSLLWRIEWVYRSHMIVRWMRREVGISALQFTLLLCTSVLLPTALKEISHFARSLRKSLGY